MFTYSFPYKVMKLGQVRTLLDCRHFLLASPLNFHGLKIKMYSSGPNYIPE